MLLTRSAGGTPAAQTTTTTYMSINKPLTVTDPLGYTTSYGYDIYGRRTSTLDAENRLRQYVLDGNGRLFQIIDALGATEETRGLYPGGYLNTIKDARNNTSTFIRDGIARVTQINYPDPGTGATSEIYTLDGNGNLQSLQTRGGKTIGQTFDGSNRALTRSPQGQPVVNFTYDLSGRMKTAWTTVVAGDPSSGTFSRGYDAAGRLTSESSPNKTTPSPAYDVIGYQLDANGNVTRITYPSGYHVDRTFDELDRLTSITLNGATKPAATLSYDGLDRRLKLAYDNTAVTAYSFDIGNNRATTDLTAGSASASWSFDYNKVHQVIGKLTMDSTYEWLLNTAANVTYGDGIHGANALNQYPSVGGVTQTYDTEGRLTNDGNFTYFYNTEHMLTQVKNASGSTVISSYLYDPFKRQTQKNVSGILTRYVYSGSQLMEEYDCTAGLPGTLLRRYVYAGPEEAIFQTDAAGNVTYLHHDTQGSLIAQSNSLGAVLRKYTYSPFGESTDLVSQGGSTIGYTGQRFDGETGLYYYKARHYNPTVGRFLQPDPIGYAAGMNLYGYVHNDPVNRTDADGTDDLPGWLRDANRIAGYIVDGFANDSRIHRIIDTGGSIVGFSHEDLLKGVAVGAAAAASKSGAGDVATHKENIKPIGDGLDSSHSVSQNQSRALGIDPKDTATMKMDPQYHQMEVPKYPNGTPIEDTYAATLRAHAKYAQSIGRENQGNIIEMIRTDSQQPAIRDIITKLIKARL